MSIQHIPFSDEIRQLISSKTNLLLRARFRKSAGDYEEAKKLFEEVAQKEELIGQLLEDSGNGENAVIHLVSAASCYVKAEKYDSADTLLNLILSKSTTAALHHEIQPLLEECYIGKKKREQQAGLVTAVHSSKETAPLRK